MPRRGKRATLETLNMFRKRRRVQTAMTLALVVLGPVLTILTFLVLGPLDQGHGAFWLRPVLLLDFVYVLVVAALIMQRIARMVAARRARSAGSRLHLRLTGVFAIVALLPAVLVAVFAAITINFGLEGWFSERVRGVIASSVSAAEAYEAEHRRDLIRDATALAFYIDSNQRDGFSLSDGELQAVLFQGQLQVQRGLREAFIINGNGEIRTRGDRSYLFDFERPSLVVIARALSGEVSVTEDWSNNEFRAVVLLKNYTDHLLYVSRQVDGELLGLLDDTKETAGLYQQLESDRGRLLFEFGLLYLGFAVILILAAIWLGLWFAERLARPVGQLAGAAQKVGAGDLNVQVEEEEGDDEIAMLGRLFNQMTRQLRGQRERLIESTRQIERRRRLFDSVLSSVTSGVIGLDGDGLVMFVNRAASTILALNLPETQDAGPTGEIGSEIVLEQTTPEAAPQVLAVLVPEFAALFDRLRASARDVMQEEIRLTRDGRQENLLVRIATRNNSEGRREGYVIAFDDVTDLVSAQRMAAWGDVARRIAHEIKNPLTPIQLSAERLKRKYLPVLGAAESETLTRLTDVIIRQTGDLRRIVDEFSEFARMPEPERRSTDLVSLVRDAVILQDTGQQDVTISAQLPAQALSLNIDETMISQALMNLIKNAAEATETYREKAEDLSGYNPEVRVSLTTEDAGAEIRISDNGNGLPADRARLFEPYVTTRDSGTGLGLPIVKKIIEEHGGTLSLESAAPFAGCTHRGAQAIVLLPFDGSDEAAPATTEAAGSGKQNENEQVRAL